MLKHVHSMKPPIYPSSSFQVFLCPVLNRYSYTAQIELYFLQTNIHPYWLPFRLLLHIVYVLDLYSLTSTWFFNIRWLLRCILFNTLSKWNSNDLLYFINSLKHSSQTYLAWLYFFQTSCSWSWLYFWSWSWSWSVVLKSWTSMYQGRTNSLTNRYSSYSPCCRCRGKIA